MSTHLCKVLYKKRKPKPDKKSIQIYAHQGNSEIDADYAAIVALLSRGFGVPSRLLR